MKVSKKKIDPEEEVADSSVLPHFVALKRINPTSSPDRLIDEIQFIARHGERAMSFHLLPDFDMRIRLLQYFPIFHVRTFG